MNLDVTATAASPTAALRDAFIDLVCQDDDLVRAEFDALVDAAWHIPPDRPCAPSPEPSPGPGPVTPAADTRKRAAGGPPARQHWRRQRGPP